MEVLQTSPSGSKVGSITKFFRTYKVKLVWTSYATFFCTHCHHGLKVPTPLRFPGHASLSLQPPSFKWESFRGSVIRSVRGSVIRRYWFNRLFPQETSCRTGIGEEKEDGMEDFYVCQIKIPPPGIVGVTKQHTKKDKCQHSCEKYILTRLKNGNKKLK